MVEMQSATSPLYEGCDRDGPIQCLFLAEFHHIAGPKITCQVPEDYISKDTFEAVNVYIIPKHQLQQSTLTITAFDLKILGYPVKIDNNKYARNAFYFNLCFVFDAWARTVQYEALVKKLSEYLMEMELETEFLSQQENNSQNKIRLVNMFKQVLHDLNANQKCSISEGTMTTHLKVRKMIKDPLTTLDHEVPVFLDPLDTFQSDQWDLTTQQVLPYINGVNHVAKIASEANVESNLVKACLQNLVYYGAVKIVPIFQYSNIYAANSKLHQLATNKDLQTRCIEFVAKSARHQPCIRDIFRLYSNMKHGTTIRDLCTRFNPREMKIDERKLIQFGVLEKLIRRICKFPVLISGCIGSNPAYQHFNGLYSLDEICCSLGLNIDQLDNVIEVDQNVAILWK